MPGKLSLILIAAMSLAAYMPTRAQASAGGAVPLADAAAGATDDQQAPPVIMKIDHQGQLYWNFIQVSEASLKAQLAVVSRMVNQPVVEVIIDKRDASSPTVKTAIAKVLADAAQYKISKVVVKER